MSAVAFFVGAVGMVCVFGSGAGEVGLGVLGASCGVRDFCEKYGKVDGPDS